MPSCYALGAERALLQAALRARDEKGKMTATQYTIYEQPQPPDDTPPGLGNPILENLTPGNPTTENPTQLNKDKQKADLPKKDKIILHFPCRPRHGKRRTCAKARKTTKGGFYYGTENDGSIGI